MLQLHNTFYQDIQVKTTGDNENKLSNMTALVKQHHLGVVMWMAESNKAQTWPAYVARHI